MYVIAYIFVGLDVLKYGRRRKKKKEGSDL